MDEGRLDEALRTDVEDHLAGCAHCCGQVGFLARVADLPAPPAVPGRLLALAQGERWWLAGRLRPAALAAAGVGLAAVLLVVFPRVLEESLPGDPVAVRGAGAVPAERSAAGAPALSAGAGLA